MKLSMKFDVTMVAKFILNAEFLEIGVFLSCSKFHNFKIIPREARLVNLSGRAELSRAHSSEGYIYIYIGAEDVRTVAWQQ